MRATDTAGNTDPTPAIRAFTVDATPPVVTITAPEEGATLVVGQSVLALYGCAEESGGSGLASCVGSVANGAAVDTAGLGVKTFMVTSTDNAGNTQARTARYTVVKGATTTTLRSSVNPSVSAQTLTYTATVAVVAPASGPLSGTVAFTDGASTIAGCAVALVSGQATCMVSYPSPGMHAIKATYSGNSLFMGSSSATLTQTVNKADTKLVASKATRTLAKVTFSATLTRVFDAAPLAGKTVAFKIAGSTVCSATTNTAGKAGCTVIGLVIGSGTYTAAYAGDSTYKSINATAQP